MSRFFRFLGRMCRGEDVILIRQSKERWEHQFSSGRWDWLQVGQVNTAEIARLVLNYAKTKSETVRVLDVGCGNGGLARLIMGEPGIDYTGVDISETALTAARATAPRGHFVAADAEYPPSDIGTFDILIFNEVLYYMNPDRALPCYRVHATIGARVFVSMARSWRTPFVFRRIRHWVRIEKIFRVIDRHIRWDVAVGNFL